MVMIAHISDLHFGLNGQEEVWKSLLDYLLVDLNPQVVFVTGDIVDSPKRSDYHDARVELEKLAKGRHLFVCPGNHDRHPFGNAFKPLKKLASTLSSGERVEAWFDKEFVGMIANPKKPADFGIPSTDQSWDLRVLGIDTSHAAKYSAHGIALAEELNHVSAKASVGDERHLVIVLQHHHLLPVMEHEGQQQGLYGLLNTTLMLNAGTVLETLTNANVNLLLHGHEHQRTVARYGSLHDRQAEMAIVGAGSATGVYTKDLRCYMDRANFNVIDLRDDRSVWLLHAVRKDRGWSLTGAPEIQLLDSKAIRRARFYRRIDAEKVQENAGQDGRSEEAKNEQRRRGEKARTRSKIVKCMEFRKNRDIAITESWINIHLKNGRYEKVTANSSGSPSNADVVFRWKDARPRSKNIEFLKHPTNDHTYWVQETLAADDSLDLESVTISFRWRGGAVLTTDDFPMLPHSKGEYRNAGYEFAGVDAITDLESLSLLVHMPPEYAPRDSRDIVVLARKTDGAKNEKHSNKELSEMLRFHGPGFFSLEVPYPYEGYEYALAWRPRKSEAQPSSIVDRFQSKVRNSKQSALEFLEAFRSAAKFRRYESFMTYALYIASSADPSKLQKVGQLAAPEAKLLIEPPGVLDLKKPALTIGRRGTGRCRDPF